MLPMEEWSKRGNQEIVKPNGQGQKIDRVLIVLQVLLLDMAEINIFIIIV